MIAVKELADQLHVSRQTIRNEMKRQGIKPIDGKDSYGRICFYVDEGDIEKISDEIRKRKEIREEEKPSAMEQLQKEKAALEASHEYLANQYAESYEKSKNLEAEIEQLRAQLKTKEEMLAMKEDLLVSMKEQLRLANEQADNMFRITNNLTESLKASQVLAAGYQKRIEQLTAKQEEQPEGRPETRSTEQPAGDPEQRSDKKWWQFWK